MSQAGTRAWVIRRVLQFIGPALLAVFVLQVADIGEVASLLAHLWSLELVAALLLNPVAIWLKALRWRHLLAGRGIDYPLREATLALTASLFVGMLTPGRVGDALRAQYLRVDRDVSYDRGLASVIVDRVSDLIALALLSSLALAWLGTGMSRWVTVFGLAAVLGVIALVWALFQPGAQAAVHRLPFGRLQTLLASLLTEVRAYGRRLNLEALPFTLAAYAVNFVQILLLGRAMDLPVGPLDLIALHTLGALLGLLPISIAGLGVREALFAAAFPLLGGTVEQAVAFGLAVFAAIYMALALIGWVGWTLSPPPVHGTGSGPSTEHESSRGE